MKNLKIILLCSIFLGILFYIRIFNFRSQYLGDETTFEGVLYSYQIDGNQLKAEIKAKEKLLFIYYFQTEKEKVEFSESYHIGDHIYVEGVLTVPATNRNFHLFHYQNYLKSKNIFWILQGEKIVLIQNNANLLFSIKTAILNKVEKRKNASYFKYLLLGDSSQIDDSFKEEASVLGISHLFAISGMHIHLLTQILMFILKKLTKNEKIHLFLITCFLGFYLFLTNFSPSIIRASSFYLLLYLKKIWKLKISSLFLLFCIFLLMLLYNPYYCYHLGFLFSFSVSFALLYFSKDLKETSYLKQLFQTSWISFWVGIPILIRNFFEINFLTPIWNLFFVPFVSFLLFPMCLICLFLPFCNPMLDFLLLILQITMDFGNHIRIFQFSFSYISIPFMILYYLVIFYALSHFLKKRYKHFIWVFVLLFCHYHMIYLNPYPSLTMIDVGQGDSILIVLPHNRGNILIDTGGLVSYQKEEWMRKKKEYSIGESVLIPYLRSVGIHQLDYLILTHGDVDHMKEASVLVKQFLVRHILMNSGNNNDLERDLFELSKKKKIPVSFLSRDTIEIGKQTFCFLNEKNRENENEDSLIVYTKLNDWNILLMGDAGEVSERKLMSNYQLPQIDFLKVGHHGSKGSSSFDFIEQIKPRYALISAGQKNRFGHPHLETLERLHNSTIYSTHEYGMIQVILKDKIRIRTRYVAR